MNFGRVAAGGVRARVLAEEDDEEGARGERQCGRAARNPMLSAHLRIAGQYVSEFLEIINHFSEFIDRIPRLCPKLSQRGRPSSL